jgi:hypothetical protein
MGDWFLGLYNFFQSYFKVYPKCYFSASSINVPLVTGNSNQLHPQYMNAIDILIFCERKNLVFLSIVWGYEKRQEIPKRRLRSNINMDMT